jgi:hypothetical protein
MFFVSVAAPLLAATSKVSPYADASHDAAMVRALGLGWTGAWRALDVPVSALLLFLPLGTRALRAGLVSAALGGFGGGLLYVLARRLLAGARGTTNGAALVAALASLCTTLSGAWLLESSSAGSSLLGVVLSLAPVALAGSQMPRRQKWPLLAATLGAALTYEPLVGLVACAGSLVCMAGGFGENSSGAAEPGARGMSRWIPILAGLFAGCLPFAVAIACSRLYTHRLDGGTFRAWAGEGVAFGASLPVALVTGELGKLLAALSLVGAVQVLVVDRRRRAAGATVVAVAVASALAVLVAPPAGREHFRAGALTLLGAVAVLAAVPMHWIVVAVGRAKIPLASASAAMVILFELTFPVLSLDDALMRLQARPSAETREWDDATFEPLPAGALALTSNPELYTRALASRATGELRADLALVSTLDAASDVAQRELAIDPNLGPLWRDLVLHGSPRERSLSLVAASRPLVLGFEPSWDRGLLRHLVPTGLLAVFRPEPRGASERLAALGEATLAAPEDGTLAVLTAELLDAQAKSLSSLGERQAAERVDSEAGQLSLPTATGERRPRRLLASRGSRLVMSP